MVDYKQVIAELNQNTNEISTDFIFKIKSYLKERIHNDFSGEINSSDLCDMFIKDKLLPEYHFENNYWNIDKLYDYVNNFNKKDYRKKIFKEKIASGKFYTLSDISEILNRSGSSIMNTLISRNAFPKPIGKLRGKWIWDKNKVDKWVKKFYIPAEKERKEVYKKYLTRRELLRIFNMRYDSFFQKKKFMPKSIITKKLIYAYPMGVALHPITEIEKWLEGNEKYNLINARFTKEKLEQVIEKLKKEIEKRKNA